MFKKLSVNEIVQTKQEEVLHLLFILDIQNIILNYLYLPDLVRLELVVKEASLDHSLSEPVSLHGELVRIELNAYPNLFWEFKIAEILARINLKIPGVYLEDIIFQLHDRMFLV